MRRWILAVLLVLLVAGCGIDEDALPGEVVGTTTTSTTTPGAPTSAPQPGATEQPGGTEPSQSGSAADLLLTAEDLGAGWAGAGTADLPEIPLCNETSAVDPADHAQAAFGHTLTGGVLLQTVGVFASEEDAHTAIAGFASDVESCENPLLQAEDLGIPEHGDEQAGTKLTLGGVGAGAGATVTLVSVRVGDRVTALTIVDTTGTGDVDVGAIVDAAAAKL